MSSPQVEPFSIPNATNRHLTNTNIQTINLMPARSTSHMSHGPVIDLDGEERRAQRSRRTSRRIPTIVLDDDSDEPPSNRRRTTSGTQDHPVFLLDDTHNGSSSRRRRLSNGAQSRPIVVSDSEVEESTPVASGSTVRRIQTARRGRSRSGIASASFRVFSPPPLPHREIFQADPPIIADPMPFAILPPAANDGRSAAPRHGPASSTGRNGSGIQLGGGLLSQTVSSPRHRRSAAFSFSNLAGLLRTVTGVGPSSNPPPRRRTVGHVPPEYTGLQRFFVNWNIHHAPDEDELFGEGGDEGPWGRRDAALGLVPEYYPSMTHPGRPGPGWTFDFGDEDGNAGDGGAEILVCALCLDPLLANAEGMVEVSDEERRNRRIWGLRCGHVLDGKCVGRLMHPDEDVVKVSKDGGTGTSNEVEGKGKGKQKEAIDENAFIPRDIKGKGKAPATPSRAPTLPETIEVEDSPVTFTLPENPIRSRLRSRPRLSSPERPIVSIRTTRRGRGTKRKRDAEAEVVEDRYEWTCPVAGCGRSHLSIKIGGVWKMDAGDGAVGVYV